MTPRGAPTSSQLRPRPRLFVILCVIFAAWMLALIVLYFTTVYSRRHPANSGVQIPPVLNK